MAQRHGMADGTRGRISAIPAGTGHGGNYRPLCPNAVPTISAIPAGTGYGRDYRPLCPNAVSTISAIPAGIGYDGDYRPLCPNAVPMINRPLKASALYTRASVILGFVPAETSPPQCKPRHQLSPGLAHSPSTVACTFVAASTPRHSWGSHDAQDLMGQPRRPSTLRTNHSYDHAATGTGHRARTCHPYWHDAT